MADCNCDGSFGNAGLTFQRHLNAFIVCTPTLRAFTQVCQKIQPLHPSIQLRLSEAGSRNPGALPLSFLEHTRPSKDTLLKMLGCWEAFARMGCRSGLPGFQGPRSSMFWLWGTAASWRATLMDDGAARPPPIKLRKTVGSNRGPLTTG